MIWMILTLLFAGFPSRRAWVITTALQRPISKRVSSPFPWSWFGASEAKSTSVDFKNVEAAAVGPLPVASNLLVHDQENKPILSGGRQPLMSRVVRWFIRRLIQSRCKTSADLRVQVEARSNREAIKGRLDTVSVECKELIFKDLQVTGGAKVELLGVDLHTPGLLPGPMRRFRRLRRPCEVAASYELTNADLASSPAIHRLVQHAINNALRPRKKLGASGDSRTTRAATAAQEQGATFGDVLRKSLERHVDVNGVRVHGGRVAVEALVTKCRPFLVPLRYEFSLDTSHDGHLVHLKDLSVYWSISADRDVHLSILPLKSFNIDLGDRTKIERLKVAKDRLSVGGRFILSPESPGKVSSGQSRGDIRHDLAETLSSTVLKVLRIRRD